LHPDMGGVEQETGVDSKGDSSGAHICE